jgi:hypothetical protein
MVSFCLGALSAIRRANATTAFPARQGFPSHPRQYVQILHTLILPLTLSL